MSDSTKAVFLSYASQDAEAAKRIADALRAAGVEVWFDAEGGLEHGDEWDAKIRRQIKECVLFIAVISANTQAREEGYFRIEWDLAAERARGIASGVAFILPVVIDDTKEPAALVPDRFRVVQWTRLPGGNVSPEVLQRFLKVWSHRTGVVKNSAGSPVGAALRRDGLEESRPQAAPTKRPAWPWVALGLVALGITAFVFLGRKTPAPSAPAIPPAPAISAVQADAFPRDPELRRTRQLLYTMDAIPEDFRLAEDLLKPVLAQQPNDPETATVAAEVALEFLVRGFDNSAARRAQAQRLAERAVQLAPDNGYALATLSRYLLFNGAQLARAEELIRKAIALRPEEARFHRALHYILFLTRPAAETDAYGERMAAQFPRDPLVAYDIARRFKDSNDLVEMEKWFDRSLAAETPVAFAMIWKAWLAVLAHGDLEAMKQWIDRVPDRQRNNTRVVNARYVHALFSGETRAALRALNELTDEWLTDFDLTVPKSLLIGNLARLEGRNDLARAQFEAALATVAAEVEKNPSDLRPQRARLWVLIGLGRMEEARAIQRMLLQTLSRPWLSNITRAGWTNPIISCLLLDLRPDALSLLRDSSGDANCRRMLRSLFKLDPRLKPWRDDAEINALLAEPKRETAATPSSLSPSLSTPPDAKSVAVLAFANLSDDKTNEYFSDGISEELLNVLAKIPGLKVSARTSAFYFKGKEVPIPEIAKQLGVAYVVEGSVRKSGDKVRITAQLIKAADGFHVWSDTFTRDLKDIFAVQDEIAGLIAKNLELKMGMVAARPTIDVEAYQEYLTGRAAVAKASMTDLRKAVTHFEQAVALEPKFTAAWVQLASAHTRLGRWGGTPTLQAWQAARAAIDRAQALEPDSPDVLLALGWILRTAEWDWRGAERAFRRALQLQPNQPDALAGAAVLLFNIGQTEEAYRLGWQAAQLDPLNAGTQIDLSIMFFLNGNWPEAERAARRALQLAPRGTSYHSIFSWSLIRQGRYAEAETEIALESDEVERTTATGLLALARGQGARAREQLARLVEISRTRGDLTDLQQSMAWIYGGLGEKDRAFAALEKARASRDPSMSWLKNSGYLDSLYSDPRWPQLLRQVGLADDQLK